MNAVPPSSWGRYGTDWPNRASSRFLRVGALTWHVQIMGQGPKILLIHGTGAATHSWRDLAPALARHFTVYAPDLPGHGFTSVPPWHGLSLPCMARDLKALLESLDVSPALVVGHSAGGPILARMCLDGMITPSGLVALNGAFMPLLGPVETFFAPLAQFLVGLPLLPKLFSWRAGADPRMVEKLLAGTGSQLDAAGIAYYSQVVRNPDHAGAALRMMASWDLVPVVRDLPALGPKLLLVVGENDRTIPPADAGRVRELVPGSEIVTLPGLGHLAHEERPDETAALIVDFARALHILPP
jgi:putative magnesium chelatase accessory protein